MPFPMRFAAPFAAMALLSACGDATPVEEADVTEPAIAPADAPVGMSITDQSIRLPAVDGRPGVAYFKIATAGTEPLEIASIFIENVGRTELHETIDEDGAMSMRPVETATVPANGSLELKPGGMHLMLFDIGPEMVASGMAEMTISFANGDKASIAVPVSAAGDAMDHGSMEGMN